MKYEKWLNEWLDNYVKIASKHRTIERYTEIVNQHLIPSIGDYELQELTPILLQKYVTELLEHGNKRTGQGLAASSVNSIITVIQSSLHIAYNLGYIDNRIGDKIKRPKMAERQVECFTKDEQKRIEQAVLDGKKPYMIGILISLYTGVRIGELLSLEWKDVDFENRLLKIDKTCHYGKDQSGAFVRITDTPKTDSSVRIIPLPKQLIPIIKSCKKQCMSSLIISRNGKGVSTRTYQRNFDTLLKSLQIPHRGFHALRHTFATRAIECGMDVKTLSEILGHKSSTITLNRYVHSLLNHKKEMMDRLGKLFS